MSDLDRIYSEHPRRSYNLDRAWKQESKTKQLPFVVASETVSDGTNFESHREFLIFHDVDHFFRVKEHYPHVHEIVRCPRPVNYYHNNEGENDSNEDDNAAYRDDLCKGRLIFDFDLSKPIPGMENLPTYDSYNTLTYVPPNFTQVVNHIISVVMTRYYKVDVGKLGFGWQHSFSRSKFSMHLIVENAYFSEYWPKQMKIFYELFKYVADQEGHGYVNEAVDWQIARRNGTFRMIGASKIGGSPLLFYSYTKNGMIYQSNEIDMRSMMVGVYNYKDMLEEQLISMDCIKYDTIGLLLDDTRAKKYHKILRKQLGRPEDIDEEALLRQQSFRLEENDIAKIMDLFDEFNSDGAYFMRDKVGSMFNMQRRSPSACPISGHIHENENPYMFATYNGVLIFKCRRGCTDDKGFSGYIIGVYNQTLKDQGDSDYKDKMGYKKPKLQNVDFIKPTASKESVIRSQNSTIQQSIYPNNNLQSIPIKSTKTALVVPKILFVDNSLKSKGNSSTLMAVGINKVQIPSMFRKAPTTYRIK
jgi:hypothetical protein